MTMVNDQVDADPDGGSDGDDANDDPRDLALGWTDTTVLSFGRCGEGQEKRETEEKSGEFVAQG